MVLKYLEIQGFKSFPDKTKITFNQGLTAVVGPNGSGKSNISDAIRWVMGEQSNKNLRGSNMEDVIFTGTKARKSQGFAEVSLCIDNSDKTLPIDEDEVIISRRYSRSGDSEYRINRTIVRLRDINELFMDTGLGKDGYAMVGQGKIAEIVQSKSDERRVIFEEAAGISKFRSRKAEAQKKLNAAEDNLVRLRDILQELEDRVAPLKAQSEKAKRFLELAEQKKTAEISSWMYTLDQSNSLLKDQSDRILARRMEHEEVEAAIEKMEAEIQSVYDQMQQCLIDIDNLRREKDETEQRVSGLNAAIAVCENDVLHNTQNQTRIEGDIAAFLQSGELFTQEIAAKQQGLRDNQARLAELTQQIADKEHELLELTEKSGDFTDSQSVLSAKISELLVLQSQHKMNLMQLSTQKSEAEIRYLNNSQSLEQKRENVEQTKKELQNANELADELERQSQSLQNTISGYNMKLKSRQEKLEELQKSYNKTDLAIKEKKQRAKLLQDLENNMEGFAYSVKSVLSRGKKGMLSGILGTVSQLITVPEAYSTAIETALGGSLQHIVVESENDGKSAIQFLKRENAGRATFLPLTSIRGNRLQTAAFEHMDGYVSLACDLIAYDAKFQNVVYSMLGRIVIAEDLDSAVTIAKKNGYKFKIVTLDGQVVNAGGSMSGGSKNKSQGFLSRKSDIVKLMEEAKALEQQAQAIRQEGVSVKEEVSALRAQLVGVNGEVVTVNEDKIRCEGEQKRLTQFLAQEEEQLADMRRELDEHQQKLEEREQTTARLKQELEQVNADLQSTQEHLDFVQGKNDAYLEARNRLTDELSDLRYQKLETEKDMEAAQNTIADLRQRNRASGEQLEALQTEAAQLTAQNAEIQAQIEAHRAQIASEKENSVKMEQAVLDKMALRSTLESKTTSLRQDEKSLSVQKERLGQDLARFEERKLSIQKEYDTIINKLWEEYQLTKSEAAQFAKPVDDMAALTKQLNSLKAQIKALGSVNVAAIEEYVEVSERYEFLSAQLSDVEQSRHELLTLIDDLTVKMREIFAENFARINQHFKRIFVELFGGGRAELKLTDPDDILNCGIEILVEPPGKIIKSLTLLSGGEQAFIAIAIYFAILKVRPAPFCVLDEIEAALDDVNVSKYAKYLRQMSDNTQFIMITHRRGTMEEADVLYGVTMQEDGVSKLLQLKVTEIEKQMGKLE